MGPMRIGPRHLALAAAALAVLLGVALAARCTRIADYLDYLDAAKLQRAMASLAGHPLLPIMLLGAFVAAGALFISVWFVIAQTALFYGPAVSIPLAFAGALLSALLAYGAGRVLGERVVERIAPARVRRAVQGAGFEAIVAVRLLPVLPFTFVNLCAGAFHVHLRTYVVGTLVGMGPGVIAVCVLGERLMVLVRNPTPSALAWAAVGTAVFGAVLCVLHRRAKGSRARPATQDTSLAP